MRAQFDVVGLVVVLLGSNACGTENNNLKPSDRGGAFVPDASSEVEDAGGRTASDIRMLSAQVSENWLSVELEMKEVAFFLTCGSSGVEALDPVEKDWVTWDDYRVNAGSYVDGHYTASPGCDVVDCVELKRAGGSLLRLERVGEATVWDVGSDLSPDWRDGGTPEGGTALPVYETRVLSGRVRVYVEHFGEEKCLGAAREFGVELDLSEVAQE